MALDRRTTLESFTVPRERRAEEPRLVLTLLWHPDATRIGRAAVVPLGGGPVDLSRLAPVFDDGEPLAAPMVSRSPLRLVPDGGGLRLQPLREGLPFEIDGARGVGGETIDAARLGAGVLLGLGGGPILSVRLAPSAGLSTRHGLVGASAALEAVRRAIDEAAPRDVSVLVRGESGTGKELVARALHHASRRAEGPYVALNLAALPASTAPSQLFGHARGAFTGADRPSAGYFGQAEGGTLFLDEIGACPVDVQALLLRALENGEIQPVGAPVRTADVRVVAATDEDLDAAVRSGSFRSALLHRLARVVIRVPPLRERPEDVAVLAVRYLGAELTELGREDRLLPSEQPWLGRDVMRALLRAPWSGNVRELQAVCARLAYAYADDEVCGAPFDGVPATDPRPTPPDLSAFGASPAQAGARKPRPTLAEGDLEALLAAHDFRVGAVAEALGVSVNTVRKRMEALALPRPRDLDPGDIAVMLATAGSVEAAARALRVSAQGLRLRMAELGMMR